MDFHGRNLRRGRHSEPGRLYLVTTVVDGRRPLLADLFTGRLLARELRASDEAGLTRTLCWVAMPDHLHWMFELDGCSLATAMRRLKSSSAIKINRYHGRSGPVWQRGYHDHAIRQEEDIRALARYVIANPVRAGLCETVRQYPHWDACWL